MLKTDLDNFAALIEACSHLVAVLREADEWHDDSRGGPIPDDLYPHVKAAREFLRKLGVPVPEW